jgi:hypothetical protein
MLRFGFEREFREPVFSEEDSSSLARDIVTSWTTFCRSKASAKLVRKASSQGRFLGEKQHLIYPTADPRKHKRYKGV